MLHITIHPPRPIALLARYSESLFRQRIKVSDLIHPYNDPHLRCKYIRLRTNRPIPLYRATYSLHRTSPFPPQSRSIYLRYRTHPPLLLPHSCKETTPHSPTLAQYTPYEPPHICAPSPLLLRTFPQTSMGKSPHRSAPSPDNPRKSHPTLTHLRPATHARTAPHLCTLAIAPAYISPNFYGEIAPRSRTYHITPPYQCVPLSAPSSSDLCTFALFSTEEGICYMMRTERCSHTIKSLVPSCTSVCTEVLEKSL